ncbi:protein kinase domain-containing protein [Roseateles asaccharophilus]|uniref:non-specific serine/threonine protein kinase n=1 Tax=Roseateles asaccharophilus TaxID=582607 RepID=A0ABU2AE41_9BURK|nr:protein kinase [Roseateles asaccharophilus]MDR7335468.1 serine/threonine protein kinase [Roseateles asaccharophilus]
MRDEDSLNALPAGTRFGELEILGTLGVGGFGIVYLARDHSLEREVAIKEYMPSQFAQRDGRSQVSVRSISMKETFDLGRRSFVNEAKLLARFDHPSLLKVYRFWEANGTAYMAMPRLIGQNLREARKAQPTPPPEAWLRRIFDAVLGGLAVLHAQNVWHRDVAPDNIFMPADGSPPILLDFGAARQAIGDRTQVFTAILKPSYAPIEQYAEATSLKQGPWTDFYALAAAMHDLLTGRPPPPCTARAMGDELAPLAVEGYSPAFLAGLDWALRVPPHQRPQNAAAWREVLDGRAPVPEPVAAPPRTVAPQPIAPPAPLDLEFADTVQAPIDDEASATIVVPLSKRAPPKGQEPPVAAPAPAAAQGKPRRALLVGGAVAAVLLLGFFVLLVRDNIGKPPPQTATPPVAAASMPVVASAASAPEPIVQAASQPPAVVASAPAVVAPPLKTQPAPAVATAATRPASAPTPRRDTAAKPMVTEKAGDFRPVPRSPVFAAPEPAASTPAGSAAVKSAAASTPPTAPAGEAASPSEACGKRVLLARAWCIDRQCERPLFQNHAECVKLREIRNSHGRVP